MPSPYDMMIFSRSWFTSHGHRQHFPKMQFRLEHTDRRFADKDHLVD